MSQLFIGFYGWPAGSGIDQDAPRSVIAEGFECWNLRKFSPNEFVDAIKEQIPPVNANVLINYINNGTGTFGASEEQYGEYLWGLLLPDPADDSNGYFETVAIINLFSSKYMHPAFYVDRMGITKLGKFKEINVEPNDMQGHEQFKTENFVSFYTAMIDQMKYFIWKRVNVTSWSKEDWRLFMAAIFYNGLDEYQKSKSGFTWQRESTDMSTLLETLLTAGDQQTEEIGYRLRKRAGVLIGWKFNDIETELKTLYKDRSEFVHGSYYKKIISEMRRNQYDTAMPPPPDFKKIYKTKERIRIIFAAYLFLHKHKISGIEPLFNPYDSVQDMLEHAILNIELRNKIIAIIKPIVEMLPFTE